jgi:hypothetical protein
MFGFGKRFIEQVGKDIEAQEIERKKCADIQRKQYEKYIVMLDAEYKRREHNIAEAIGFAQKCYNENVGKRDIKIWNEAIEACLNEVRTSESTSDYVDKIRKLKK